MTRICPVCHFETFPLRDGEMAFSTRLPDVPLLYKMQEWSEEEVELHAQWQVFLNQLVRFTDFFPSHICLHKDALDGDRWKIRARGTEAHIRFIISYFVRQADELRNRLCVKIAFDFRDQALERMQTDFVGPNVSKLTPYPSSPLAISEPFTE